MWLLVRRDQEEAVKAMKADWRYKSYRKGLLLGEAAEKFEQEFGDALEWSQTVR